MSQPPKLPNLDVQSPPAEHSAHPSAAYQGLGDEPWIDPITTLFSQHEPNIGNVWHASWIVICGFSRLSCLTQLTQLTQLKRCLWSRQEANLVSNRTPKLCEQIEACILSHTASSKYLIPSDPMEGKTWYQVWPAWRRCALGRYDEKTRLLYFWGLPHWLQIKIAHLDTWTLEQYGCVWKWLVPLCTQWFCWSLSLWKMEISLGILTQHFQTNPYGTIWNNHLSRLWDFSYTSCYTNLALRPFLNTLPPSCMKALAMEMYNKDKMKGGATWWIRPSKYLPHDSHDSHMTTWPASFFERNGVHLDSKFYDLYTSLH